MSRPAPGTYLEDIYIYIYIYIYKIQVAAQPKHLLYPKRLGSNTQSIDPTRY